MVKQGYSTYDSRTTEDMFRVARIATPVAELNQWVATAWGRSWYRDGSGYWCSVGGDSSGHLYDEQFMRDLLSEQLNNYLVSEASSLWDQH